eukprot:TRINITY_DN10026_c0_g1_i5.p1 TRINITY_DN10026_c0_g1~~TRINITY_DN10026_c0_g1_i5.p1  ORF type:complete len:411 (-),score=70.27 TRINITY_DN10026_c0_g1_i5:770-2002(-)
MNIRLSLFLLAIGLILAIDAANDTCIDACHASQSGQADGPECCSCCSAQNCNGNAIFSTCCTDDQDYCGCISNRGFCSGSVYNETFAAESSEGTCYPKGYGSCTLDSTANVWIVCPTGLFGCIGSNDVSTCCAADQTCNTQTGTCQSATGPSPSPSTSTTRSQGQTGPLLTGTGSGTPSNGNTNNGATNTNNGPTLSNGNTNNGGTNTPSTPTGSNAGSNPTGSGLTGGNTNTVTNPSNNLPSVPGSTPTGTNIAGSTTAIGTEEDGNGGNGGGNGGETVTNRASTDGQANQLPEGSASIMSISIALIIAAIAFFFVSNALLLTMEIIACDWRNTDISTTCLKKGNGSDDESNADTHDGGRPFRELIGLPIGAGSIGDSFSSISSSISSVSIFFSADGGRGSRDVGTSGG